MKNLIRYCISKLHYTRTFMTVSRKNLKLYEGGKINEF
jgi:hypothetical protein